MAVDLFKLRAKDVMVKDTVHVYPNDSLDEALTLMVENRVSALPVIDGHQRCVGFISSTDLLEMTREIGDDLNAMVKEVAVSSDAMSDKLEAASLLNRQVNELMSDTVMSVLPDDSLVKVSTEMVRSRVHHLAVVDKQNHLQGILSTMDILGALANSDG